jgi:hypothetical protein
MIKFQELKEGDLIMAEFEGERVEGIVKDLNTNEKEVCVETPVQEFWFTPDHLYGIPVNEAQLLKLGFVKHTNEDGTVKYMKDSFRILTPKQDDFTNFDIWWREDRRHINSPIFVHELQNHYYQMTKVELTSA